MTVVAADEHSARLAARLEAARQRSCALRLQAGRLVDQARASVPSDPDGFTVCGTVDGETRVVRWRRGRLLADEDLRLRMHLVVELAQSDGPGPVPSLHGSRTQLLLAVLRGFDRVRSVVLTVPDDDRPAPECLTSGLSGGPQG